MVLKYLPQKINGMAKMGLTNAISIVNWILRPFFIKRKYFCFSSLISEILNRWNFLKTCIQTSYLIDFCILWEKMIIFDFFFFFFLDFFFLF